MSSAASKGDGAENERLQPRNLTLALIGAWSRLDWKARVAALSFSVFLNIGLPFINGIMIGFGEIFARTVAWPYMRVGLNLAFPGTR